MIKTFPLENITIEEASQKQFKLVDLITQEFEGQELLSLGDLGVNPLDNMPTTTRKIERIIANFFSQEDAVFVRGSGTGSIREALYSVLSVKDTVLVHTSKIYTTTENSFDMLGVNVVMCDFNDIKSVEKMVKNNENINAVLIQYTRQSLQDSYDISEVIKVIKEHSKLPIISDDNYAVMKVDKIGCELGADMSCFSTFKLLGPEGIGLIVGKKEYISKVRSLHYSGGSQTQGFESMEALRGLVYAPVLLAIQGKEVDVSLEKIINNNFPEIDSVFIANAQSRVIIVKFNVPIAKKVLHYAQKFGAIPYPVGSESKYEITPLFYKVSGTMLRENADAYEYYIRINPMRAGSKTVLKILEKSLKEVKNVS